MSRKAKTDTYAVAFIDFLGVKEMIANDDDGKLLIVFRAACKAALHMCKKILNDEDEVTIKMFSDNLVLCKRIYNPDSKTYDVQGAVRRVLVAASLFQYFVLDTIGVLVRGGITIGELYIDNMMVWGQALVDAYRIESQTAIYPRIVVDPKLIAGEYADILLSYDSIEKDLDGLYYLNYIHMVWKVHKIKSYEETLDKFVESNREELEKHGDLADVIQKRKWQAEYLRMIASRWINILEEPDEEETDFSNEQET